MSALNTSSILLRYFKTILNYFLCVQPEPFFITFAIYDAKERKKISEDFHVNPNEPEIQAMLPADLQSFFDKGGTGQPDLNGLKDEWLSRKDRQVGLLCEL
jgi:hypothetical protein